MNKKLLKSLFVVILAFAGVFAVSHYANAVVKGDVNGDGFVTSSDVTAVYDVLLGNDNQFEATADVNGDGFVTSSDVTMVYDILLGNAPVEDYEDVYVLGEINGNSWGAATGVKMTTEDGKTYTVNASFAGENEGYSYFSFTKALADDDEMWDAIADKRFGAVSEGDFLVTPECLNTPLDLTTENGQAFKIPAGEYELTVDLEAMTLTIGGEIPVEYDNVYILGEVNGKTWSATDGVQMATENGKTYTAHVTTAGENDGYSYFGFSKALADTTSATPWDDIAAQRFGAVSEGDFLVTSEMAGQTLSLTTENYQAFKIPAGEYDFTVNLDSMTLVIEGNIVDPVEPQPETQVWILGEVNGNSWSATNGVEMTTEDGNIFNAHVTTSGENDGYSYFSFTKALAENTDDWDAIAMYRFGAVSEGDFLVTSEMAGQTLSLTTENYQAFKIPAGEYDFTVNLDSMTLVIEGNIVDPVTPQPENKVYILGEVNGNNWATNVGVEMTSEDGKIFTAAITTQDSGFSYFGFTKALADGDQDWDDIAPYRFGAVGESNVNVTEDMLGTEIALTAENYQAIQMAPGTFNLSLDLENMKLTITGEFTPQQPAGDGWYLVGTNNNWSTSDKSYPFVQDAQNENVYSIHVDNVSGDFWFKIAAEGNYDLADFWSGDFLGAAIDGESALSGNLVSENVNAFCIPASYNCTYLDITIDVENLTYTITTDGQEPIIDPTAEYDYVYIAGTADGWSGNGGKLASVKDANDYYGFITTTGEFKIQKNQGSWATNWGGSNGTLVAGGANIQANGLVYVNANIGNMTYSVTSITSMGVIGDAVNPDWSTEAPLTYNAETNTWEGNVTLTAGEIKFRANNAWDINFGGALNNLVAGGNNIAVEAGTYKVVLTLVCPGEYTATLTPVN